MDLAPTQSVDPYAVRLARSWASIAVTASRCLPCTTYSYSAARHAANACHSLQPDVSPAAKGSKGCHPPIPRNKRTPDPRQGRAEKGGEGDQDRGGGCGGHVRTPGKPSPRTVPQPPVILPPDEPLEEGGRWGGGVQWHLLTELGGQAGKEGTSAQPTAQSMRSGPPERVTKGYGRRNGRDAILGGPRGGRWHTARVGVPRQGEPFLLLPCTPAPSTHRPTDCHPGR